MEHLDPARRAPHLAPSRRRPPCRTLPRSVAFAGGAAAFASLYLAAGAPTPLLVEYQRDWGFPDGMLTLAFGVYALALLGSLVVFGSLSDHLGRRPVLLIGLGLQLVALALFLTATGIGGIIAARIVQGLGTGIATGTFTAALVELARDKRVGAVIGSVMPTAGLGAGALLASIVVTVGAQAGVGDTGAGDGAGVIAGDGSELGRQILFAAFAVVVAAGLVVTILSPETVTRMPGALRSLVPRVAVPVRARALFVPALPIIAACWMTGAMAMSFTPSVLGELHGIHAPLVNGVTGFVHAGAITLGGLLSGRLATRTALRISGAGLVVGTVITLVGLVTGVLPVLWIGALVQGSTFGAGFTAVIRGLAPRAEQHERGGMYAAVFVASYLSLGVPSMLAGALVHIVGIGAVAIGWCVLIIAVAGVGWVLALRRKPVG